MKIEIQDTFDSKYKLWSPEILNNLCKEIGDKNSYVIVSYKRDNDKNFNLLARHLPDNRNECDTKKILLSFKIPYNRLSDQFRNKIKEICAIWEVDFLDISQYLNIDMSPILRYGVKQILDLHREYIPDFKDEEILIKDSSYNERYVEYVPYIPGCGKYIENSIKDIKMSIVIKTIITINCEYIDLEDPKNVESIKGVFNLLF